MEKYPTQDLRLYVQKRFDNEQDIKQYHKTKDKELRNQIVINNMPLVFSIVEGYWYPTKIELGDLVAVGTITLIKAIENFEDDSFKFTTYAQKAIEVEISAYANELYGEGNRYYGEIIKRYRQIGISIFGECKELYNEETIDYIIEIMLEEKAIRPGAVPEIKSRLLSKGIISKEEVENVPIEEDFDRTAFIKEHKEELYSQLTDHEKELMEYRCGFKDGHPYNLEELASIYGITHQGIQRQIVKATGKMKKIAKKYI